LTPFPEVDWNGHDVANVAKCGEWTMQEEGEQISIVLMICNGFFDWLKVIWNLSLLHYTYEWCRNVLRRHENNQRLPEVAGHVLKYKRVVRVDNKEKWPPSKWVKISRVKTEKKSMFSKTQRV
jgi:hypothetical protein